MNKEQMRSPTKLEHQILEKKWTAAAARERSILKLTAELRVAVVIIPLLILLLLTSFHTTALAFSGSVLAVSLTRILRQLAAASRRQRRMLLQVQTGNYLVAEATGLEVLPSHSPRKQPSLRVRMADGTEQVYSTMWYLAKTPAHRTGTFPVLLVLPEEEAQTFAIPVQQ